MRTTNLLATLSRATGWPIACTRYLFSPAFRKEASGARDASQCLLDPQELAEWILADNVPARLGLQLHKFIWDPAKA